MLNLILSKTFENLDPMNTTVIKHALGFLWKGLLAIFVVIALIILVVKLTDFCVNKVTEKRNAREKSNPDPNDENQK